VLSRPRRDFGEHNGRSDHVGGWLRPLGKVLFQFGDAILDADDLVHSLRGVVRAGLIGTPGLAALDAGKPSSQKGNQLPFRLV